MVPKLPNQSANPVVPTLPVVQANVPLLGVAATIDAVRGSNSATPLTIHTLPVVQVNEPLLSRACQASYTCYTCTRVQTGPTDASVEAK